MRTWRLIFEDKYIKLCVYFKRLICFFFVFQRQYWFTSFFQTPMFVFFRSDHIQSSIKGKIILSQAFYTNKILLLQLSSYFSNLILRNMQTWCTLRIILSVMDLGHFKFNFWSNVYIIAQRNNINALLWYRFTDAPLNYCLKFRTTRI